MGGSRAAMVCATQGQWLERCRNRGGQPISATGQAAHVEAIWLGIGKSCANVRMIRACAGHRDCCCQGFRALRRTTVVLLMVDINALSSGMLTHDCETCPIPSNADKPEQLRYALITMFASLIAL
jgi:hypothetical protein